MPNRFPPELSRLLKSYVYLYSDPANGKPFYVGKGKGNRAFAHLKDTDEKAKNLRIRAIRARGQEPQIDILCYGISNAMASLVEALAISLLGRPPLLNLVGGKFTMGFGRVSVGELLMRESAKPAKIREAFILFRINELYRSNMNARELYEATRGIWPLSLRRYKAKFAMAVYQGIVREVYQIDRWVPAGFSEYVTRKREDVTKRGKWEFEGMVEKKLSKRYVGKSVRKYFSNYSRSSFHYVGC